MQDIVQFQIIKSLEDILISNIHGTHLKCQLRNRRARNAQSRLFELFKAFYYIEGSTNRIFFSPKRPIFLHACGATCSEEPSNINTMT